MAKSRRLSQWCRTKCSYADQVPVLDVDGKRLHESWDIAQYLEKQYPGTNVFKAGRHPTP